MADHRASDTILILDFGSQYTQLIARRIRELGVFSKVVANSAAYDDMDWKHTKGLIFSGGPASVTDHDAPDCDPRYFESRLPKLGICYGLQLYARHRGAALKQSAHREYGRATVQFEGSDPLVRDVSGASTAWMSHGDTITEWPESFHVLGKTAQIPLAAMADSDRGFWGVQFHPEVQHTERGMDILRNFVFEICHAKGDWTPAHFVDDAIDEIRETVGGDEVILGISGGVDSTVLAALLQRAIGERSHPILVNNGLLRTNEIHDVISTLEWIGVNIDVVDAEDLFLDRLKDVTDPEEKRKIIGRTFIEVFEAEAKKFPNAHFLAQGTLYPDWIESVSVRGPSAVIKSHHNVGGLPERMRLKLVEPLKWLFKDEVRKVGVHLELPPDILGRHPFPGPGLAVRIIGPVTREDLDLLRQADTIFIEALRQAGEYDTIWQAFSVLLPVESVGVMGDHRTYERALCLRAVTSTDGMTADWAEIPYALLKQVSNDIINNVKGINRVCYDISSKPPATIEWE